MLETLAEGHVTSTSAAIESHGARVGPLSADASLFDIPDDEQSAPTLCNRAQSLIEATDVPSASFAVSSHCTQSLRDDIPPPQSATLRSSVCQDVVSPGQTCRRDDSKTDQGHLTEQLDHADGVQIEFQLDTPDQSIIARPLKERVVTLTESTPPLADPAKLSSSTMTKHMLSQKPDQSLSLVFWCPLTKVLSLPENSPCRPLHS